jgi:hypothetical protein
MNPIHRVVQNRVDSLVAQSDAAGAVQHHGTTGSLREKYLIDFLIDLIPKGLSITSGVVCDSNGKVSRQSDIIVYDDTILPNISMTESVSIIPVETVHLTVEVKSTLRANVFQQIEEFRESFNELETTFITEPDDPPVHSPTVVLAYQNEVNETTLKNELEDIGDVVSACVIGDFVISREDSVMNIRRGDDYFEVMVFAIQMYEWLSKRMRERKAHTRFWQAYLMGPSSLIG